MVKDNGGIQIRMFSKMRGYDFKGTLTPKQAEKLIRDVLKDAEKEEKK